MVVRKSEVATVVFEMVKIELVGVPGQFRSVGVYPF